MGTDRTKLSFLARVPTILRAWARGDVAQISRARRIAIQNLRVAILVTRSDVYQRIRLHAQALSLKTLLAVVPLLAVVFSIFKGFGGLESVQNDLENLILENLAASDELRVVVHEHLGTFLSNIEGGALGPVSVVILVFSVLSLLSHIEDSVNAVFGVKQKRPLVLRFVTYWAILTLGPLVLGASLTLTGALQVGAVQSAIDALPGASQALIAATPLFISWLGFTALYVVVPNTRIRFRSAFYAALIAGTAWNILKYLYAFYASHAVTTQNIYGSLAAIPLFMLWIWLSWILVLYGAQLAFAYENASTFWRDREDSRPTQSARELLAARTFLEVARSFAFGQEPRTAAQLSEQLGFARRFVDDVTGSLLNAGYLNTLEEGGLVPGRDISTISLEDLVECMRDGEGVTLQTHEDAGTARLDEILNEVRAQNRALLGKNDFATLARAYPPENESTELSPAAAGPSQAAVDVH